MILFVLTYFLLALAIIANKIALASLCPLGLVTIRMLGGGIFLAWHERLTLATLWTYKKQLALVALYTTLINSLLKAYALQTIPAGTASLMAATDPFITALMASLMFGESVTPRKAVGVIIAALGLVILTTGPANGGRTTIFALGATLAAIAIGRYGWLRAQRLLKNHELTPGQLNSGMMLIAGLLTLPFALATQPVPHLSPSIFVALLFTTIVGNGIAYPLYATLLKNHQATLVSLGGFLVPTFVIAITACASGQPPTLTTIAAAALIASGLAVFTKPPFLMIRTPFIQRTP